jgi:hypothetical protein
LQYNAPMGEPKSGAILDRFLDPFADCLTTEVARRIVDLRLDPREQERIDELSAKANDGLLDPLERAEYEDIVEGIDLIGILKAKARAVLARNAC